MNSDTIKRMDVMVLDDSQRIRSLMASLLRDLGCCSVRPYENVELACIGIEDKQPSLVLCDWKMEGADGSVFLDRIRTHVDNKIATTPIIIVTGFGSRDILVEAMQKGATQFLVKPVVPRELLKKMAFANADKRKMIRENGRMVYQQQKQKPKPKDSPMAQPKLIDVTGQKLKVQAPVSTKDTDSAVWEL